MRPEKAIFLLGVLISALFLHNQSILIAQEGMKGIADPRSTLKTLRDSLKIVDEDIRLLQHILESATTDRRLIQHTAARSWVISNPELRDSVFYAFVAADSSVQSEAGAEAEVLATEAGDLIEVRFGTAVFKGVLLKEALRKSGDAQLYERVAQSYRYSKHIEMKDPSFRLPTRFEDDFTPYDKLLEEFSPVTIHRNPEPEKAKLDLSLYGLIFRVGPSWGGEVRVGCDEIGLPFWTSGKTMIMATYKRIKFGIEMPFTAGLHSDKAFPPFPIQSRKLNGTRGMVGEFDFGPIGGLLSFTRLTELDTRALTDPDDFAYVSSIVQGYYSFGISLSPADLIRVKVGLGYHRVLEARLEKANRDSLDASPEERIVEVAKHIYPSPVVKIEYLNKSASQKFGGSLQYYDYAVLVTGWLEIVRNVLSLEMKYAMPLLRDSRKWENKSFVIISPRLRVTI